KIINSGIIEFLESVYEYPNSIILFGSYSFGENNEQSDIDIAIQTTLNKKIDLKKYEQKLRHTIQIFLLDEKTPENLKKSIYNGIVLRGRIQ
ncbi:MAG: nucleotidyltransferase domain-containing protein, partial [Nanoarchaeota archaeon]|nr:nucleotidyltransferase domain-containing protein [Nanoarchaeota archaeon]